MRPYEVLVLMAAAMPLVTGPPLKETAGNLKLPAVILLSGTSGSLRGLRVARSEDEVDVSAVWAGRLVAIAIERRPGPPGSWTW